MQRIERSAVARSADGLAGTVLVVDDNSDVRELLGEVLAFAGYEIVEATDGAEALRLLHGGLHPRVILLDRNTPVMDGPQFLVEAGDLLRGIAVVWMTGDDHDVSHPAIVATVRKPFDIDDLVRVVHAHCPGGRAAAKA